MEICQAVTCQIRYTLDLDKLSAFETYARTWISLIEAFARAFAPEKHDPGSVIGMTMWQLKKDKPLHIVGVLDDERSMSITEPSVPQAEACICQVAPDVNLYKIAVPLADRRRSSSITSMSRNPRRLASPTKSYCRR